MHIVKSRSEKKLRLQATLVRESDQSEKTICLHHQAEERSKRSKHQARRNRDTRSRVEDRRRTGRNAGTHTGRRVATRSRDESRRSRDGHITGICGGSTARTGGHESDSRCCAGLGARARYEADLRDGDGVGGVRDGRAGEFRCRGDGGATSDSIDAGGGGCGCDCRDQGDGCWNFRDDAWVFGDPGCADAGKVGEGGLDLGL
jgi:hypothetical protein